MAFSDWQFYSGAARIDWSLDLIAPIMGTSSLKALLNNSAGDQANGVVKAVSGRTKGIEQGRMRTLIKTDTSGNANRYGIICLQSTDNVSTATPNGYFLGYTRTVTDLIVARFTSQLWSSSVALASIDAAAWVIQGTTFSLLTEWIVDTANLGGVYFAISTGAATDFSDLAVRLKHIDPTGSAHIAGVAEGLGASLISFTGGVPYTQFDQTELYSLQ
jgi:hypothetical protein